MRKLEIVFLISLFLLIVVTAVSMHSCKAPKDASQDTIVLADTTDVAYGLPMMKNLYEREFTQKQFDSICIADTLSPKLDRDWIQLMVRDYETREPIEAYMFIKSLGSDECIYRVVKQKNSKYKISKRISRQ